MLHSEHKRDWVIGDTLSWLKLVGTSLNINAIETKGHLLEWVLTLIKMDKQHLFLTPISLIATKYVWISVSGLT